MSSDISTPEISYSDAVKTPEPKVFAMPTGLNAKGSGPKYKRRWAEGILVFITALASLALLLWCIVTYSRRNGGILDSSVIGGRLTNLQAKAIDFACGALLAPLLMVTLDQLWFSNARISVINESQNHRQGVPLSSLVVASTTSSGGFDLLQQHALLRGKTGRLALFALLVLSSGFAGKMLSNFIAYEAYNLILPENRLVTLRSMADPYIDSNSYLNGYQTASTMTGSLDETKFDTAQKSSIANQMSALLTSLNFEDATRNLVDGAYVGTNATEASLNALESDIVALTNVTGYRLTIDCEPQQPETFMFIPMGETYYELTTTLDACGPGYNGTNPNCLPLYNGYFPGISTLGTSISNSDGYSFMAFNVNQTSAYLCATEPGSDNANSTNSEYGVVTPKEFNMTSSKFTDSNIMQDIWGISCSIKRQEGLHNYTRQSDSSWSINGSSFAPESEATIVKSFLANWQTSLKYQAPISTNVGLAPALSNTAGQVEDSSLDNASTMNWTIYALNYLYASGEAQRITYEVAAQNATSNTTYFYHASASVTVQKYRITYIPLLLLLGAIGVLGAALLTGMVMWWTKDAFSSKMGREVNTLRLLVDSVSGLRDMAGVTDEMTMTDKKGLKNWADGFKVRYEQVVDGGDVVIRLRHGKKREDSS